MKKLSLQYMIYRQLCLYLLKFLKETAERYPNSNIIFYSDNCCGQQKNRFLVGMYYYAVETLPIKSITHKYLIRGHTQNEGDNVSSLIEKSIKRAKSLVLSKFLTSMFNLYETQRKLEMLL
ncbi:unnamed protein product [Pieris macdunnoughi]|uniref:DUF7869 domain-containing protein n=1 Tax=Pieris macdunnoughi TaxID=345717 RepID=A0A821XQR2_9NEOP|nr:unnamed protein product [Pieris macdunnoughi]